jgi:hypothetical protein
VLAAIAEFEKTTLVAKLAAARRRKRAATGEKVEGCKSHSELRPDVVKLAKALARMKPKGKKLSLRAISTELAAQGFQNERGKPTIRSSSPQICLARESGLRLRATLRQERPFLEITFERRVDLYSAGRDDHGAPASYAIRLEPTNRQGREPVREKALRKVLVTLCVRGYSTFGPSWI